MDAGNIQVRFFQQLKLIIPSHLSMVDEVAGILKLSPDSAYRRIRGEKPISINELQLLCAHFKISADKIFQLDTGNFLFEGKLKEDSDQSFEKWIGFLQEQMIYMSALQQKHIYYLLKDISPFAHFQIPELASFKFYLWMKSILHYESMKGIKFEIGDKRYDSFLQQSNTILKNYNKIPTTEIWNIESINSTLRQIQFHDEAGSFKNKEEVKVLYGKVEEMINHIELQAEYGFKFRIGDKPPYNGAEFNMFINELILGDNTILLEAENTRISFLNHSVLYFVHTRDENFNGRMFDNLQNLMKKSTMISRVSEKERNGFFNRLRKSIHNHLDSVH